MRRGTRVVLGSVALALAALGGVGWWGWQRYGYVFTLDRAIEAAEAGRYEEAGPILAEYARRDPGHPLAEYTLGVCAWELGRRDEAVAAWRRVPGNSKLGARAALRLGREALTRHAWSEAERWMGLAAGLPGEEGLDARQTLALLAKLEGRIERTRRLLRAGLKGAPEPLGTLRELWDLDRSPYPIEQLREAVRTASGASPDDPGVRLGRANLALRSGRPDEAEALIRGVLKDRPEDPGAWRLWAESARALGRPDLAAEAVGHLGGEISREEAWALRDWAAGRLGDGARREALEGWLEADPASRPALDGLAEVEARAGRLDRAKALRDRAAELDRLAERYRDVLFFDPEPLAKAGTLGDLARRIGRPEDARAWFEIALRRDPGDAAAREALGALAPPDPDPTAEDRAALARTLAEAARRGGGRGGPASAGSRPAFEDDAGRAGLAFRYEPGRLKGRRLPETMGGGVALLDFDADGWLDVFAVQGGAFPHDPAHPHGGDRLFRNRGDGTFEDATGPAGIDAFPQGYGMGVAAGDVDNDGFPDLFVTRWRSYALYRNRGDGTFEDATEAWGLGGDRDWPSSAAFADLDGDGDLDLYVCHYLDWDASHPQGSRPGRSTDTMRYNNPLNYVARPDHLFRNDGGRFADVSEESGIAAADRDGRGLGVVAADLDGDGRVDLYVANDLTANFLFRNLGGMKFEEVGGLWGVAGTAEGAYGGSMGVAAGDLDGDGLLDLATTNFYGDSMTLDLALAPGLFADATAPMGLKVPTRYMVGWGVAFLDADADGRLDLAMTNGHLDDSGGNMPYAMASQLFLGRGGSAMVEATDEAGPGWSLPRVGRALAAGDLDNDGREDVVLVAHDTPLAYLHNRSEGGRPLTLLLEGTASNRDAVGAVATVRAGGRAWAAQRVGGGSYQSSDDPRLHFGLGAVDSIESVEVRWPSGRSDTYRGLRPGGMYRLREGDAEARDLPGEARGGAGDGGPGAGGGEHEAGDRGPSMGDRFAGGDR
jgi:tetratricopeptide (TPR) repeat protein